MLLLLLFYRTETIIKSTNLVNFKYHIFPPFFLIKMRIENFKTKYIGNLADPKISLDETCYVHMHICLPVCVPVFICVCKHVYDIYICSCESNYIGITDRNAGLRYDEHNNPKKNSEPAKHIKRNEGHVFTWKIVCKTTKYKMSVPAQHTLIKF